MTQFAWLLSLALLFSLGEVASAMADEAFASDAIVTDSEVTSTIFITDDTAFITDDTATQPPSPPQSVAGSLVIVEDTAQPEPKTRAKSRAVPAAKFQPLPKLVQQPMQVARGDLKVISNPAQSKPASLRPLRQTEPLMPVEPQMPLVQQPVQQPKATIKQVAVIEPVVAVGPVAAIEPVAASVERDQPADIQIAVHAEPVAPAASPKASTAAELLIEAHGLSLRAATTSEYTEIIQNCAAALRQDVQDDQRDFARQLNSWALNRRGQLRADRGEQELASADFQAALEFNARNWRALHNRGVSFAQSASFAEAFDDFNAVIQLNPNYAKAYANRATLYVQAKDLQAAVNDYKLAIERDAEFATAFVGLGRVCHMLGRWDDALQHFTTAIELKPTSPDIVCSRGDLQADMGLYGEALADYARTIELDPEFAHAYRNGAWLLATCPDQRYRDPENAVLGAQQALEYSYGERHVALDTLAAALASNGNFEEAVATVTQAVDLAPEDAKFTYLARLQLYQEQQPFHTEPVGDVAQATYEASDQ